jgi:hypothetical protein
MDTIPNVVPPAAPIVQGPQTIAPMQSGKRTLQPGDVWVNAGVPANTVTGRADIGQSGFVLRCDNATDAKYIAAYKQARTSGKMEEFHAWFASQMLFRFRSHDGSDAQDIEVNVPSFE